MVLPKHFLHNKQYYKVIKVENVRLLRMSGACIKNKLTLKRKAILYTYDSSQDKVYR